MGDWEWGYDHGLWGEDGIPYDSYVDDEGLFPPKRPFQRPVKTEIFDDDLIKKLVKTRDQISELKQLERELKQQLSESLPAFNYIETDLEGDLPFTYKFIRKVYDRPQRLKDFDFVENFIRSNYGYKISEDIIKNCSKNGARVDTIYVFKKVTPAPKPDKENDHSMSYFDDIDDSPIF